MEKNGIPVLINLLAIARYDHLPEYPMQFMARGMLLQPEKGMTILQYTEAVPDEETGEMNESDVRLMIASDHVSMIRSGEYSNTMVFCRGQRYEGKYVTPYGELPMGLFTHELRTKTDSDRGYVHLKYQLYFQGNGSSVNELHLEYISEGNKPEKDSEKQA